MIRRSTARDLPAIVDLWLDASRCAHDFIPYTYWLDRAGDLRDHYLPQSETHVLEVDGHVRGFVSLVQHQLAALFVAPGFQARGLGKALLSHAKAKRSALSLWVYRDNQRAVRFYRAAGFSHVAERVDAGTACVELRMEWTYASAESAGT